MKPLCHSHIQTSSSTSSLPSKENQMVLKSTLTWFIYIWQTIYANSSVSLFCVLLANYLDFIPKSVMCTFLSLDSNCHTIFFYLVLGDDTVKLFISKFKEMDIVLFISFSHLHKIPFSKEIEIIFFSFRDYIRWRLENR